MDITVGTQHPVQHVAAKCIPQIHNVVHNVGVTSMTAFYLCLATAVIVGGLTWYITKRGVAGAKIDTSNAVTAVENVPAEIKAAV